MAGSTSQALCCRTPPKSGKSGDHVMGLLYLSLGVSHPHVRPGDVTWQPSLIRLEQYARGRVDVT